MVLERYLGKSIVFYLAKSRQLMFTMSPGYSVQITPTHLPLGKGVSDEKAVQDGYRRIRDSADRQDPMAEASSLKSSPRFHISERPR